MSRRSRPSDWIFVAGAAALFLAALAVAIAVLVWAVKALSGERTATDET